ncbi:protein of unknown function UPF0102 [Desulfofarcimen acetoxidans DSM 771]|jgi:putative endonuclease|uniref:UPF0102 protein Dtox_1218 n=1 Tax=Desulfofarcimen acetoxidans (strain ATCC 49208 / DSM 771 / KCTC 5769 / VKM B-1644 / 5575) TaxID=485916 RepID=C8W5C0_DESAS|nr:YraN family protein [Desulfofarcimen acetoxidans]ACV62102.1 protein of unknown function UPF0102 [Desulfofarcimen acetoxidans DSM 771]
MTVKKQLLGRLGESVAARYLYSKGFIIIHQNFRCRLGEIDIIAREKGVTVFVEVRSRCGSSYGLPQESVVIKKQVKLRKLAQYYIARYALTGDFRFDVVAVMFEQDNSIKLIEHFRNAF